MKQRSTCFFFLFGHLSYLFHILHWIILLYFSSYKKVLHDLKQLSFLVTKAPVHLVWETAQRFYVLQAQMYNVTMSAWVEVGEVSLSKKKIDCRGGIPLWTGRILHFSTRLRKFNNIKKKSELEMISLMNQKCKQGNISCYSLSTLQSLA